MSAETYDKPSDDLIRVVNEFIERSFRDAVRDLTPMKLQKLVYFAQGWSLALAGKPLFNDPIEAWQFGPVVKTLYRRLKRYGRSSIKDYLRPENSDPLMLEAKAEGERKIVEEVWRVYKNYSGCALVTLTHNEGTPWSVAVEQADNAFGAEINREVIREYFAQKYMDGK